MTDKQEKHELEYDPAEGVELNDTFGVEHILESRDIAREIQVDKMSNIHIEREYSHREFELEQRIEELTQALDDQKCGAAEQINESERVHAKLLEVSQRNWIKKNEELKKELDEQKDLVRRYQSSAVKDSRIMKQQHDLLNTFAERFL